MQSPPADSPPNGESGKSRLDRELDEILAKNENIRLLPPPPKPTKQKPTTLRSPSSINSMIPPRAKLLLSTPIVVALGLAVIALLISDFSPLLANILCLAAVVSIILPMFQRFLRPATPPETRMWRGQAVDIKASSYYNSPIDAVKDWWSSRRR